jgi:hypothetical protein
LYENIDSPCDKASCADTFCALGDKELAGNLDGLVNVVAFIGAIRQIIMGNVIELVLVEELGSDNPWAVFDNLIDPLAVTESLGTFSGRHNCQTLALMCFVIACDADNQCCVRESLLGLFELSHVAEKLLAHNPLLGENAGGNLPKMEEIENTISVDANRSTNRRRVGLVATGRVLKLADGRRRHSLDPALFFLELSQ